MADATHCVLSLVDLLIGLLNDHVAREVAFQDSLPWHPHDKPHQAQHTGPVSKFVGEELKGDPPIWEPTAWDTAVRWMAAKSTYFHGLRPDDCQWENQIDTYERQLRSYLVDVKQGGPTHSNPVAAELLKFEEQGAVVELGRILADNLPADVQSQLTPADEDPPTVATVSRGGSSTKPKRSTERGEGRAKLIAALTKHHRYADGGCLNLKPIGNNEIARLVGVSESTASAFFRKEFVAHAKYRSACGDTTRLVAALKLLNQEFSPHHLFGAKPPGEDEREDDE